jgi:hypothetical protein
VGEIYVGQIQQGGYAVVFFNRQSGAVNMSLAAADVAGAGSWARSHAPTPPSAVAAAAASSSMQRLVAGSEQVAGPVWNVRDLWSRTSNGTLGATSLLSVTVPGSDAVMVTLTPAAILD